MRGDGSSSQGAVVAAGGTRFRVWAPAAKDVEVVLLAGAAEESRAMRRDAEGYHTALVPSAGAGSRYKYRVDGQLYPDPASRSQPEGVHGPSEVVDPTRFPWTDDAWSGLRADSLVIYELHVGAFTPAGTFDGAIERLEAIRELGVTAVQVMPVASFSGCRNWGYDGVALYAPTHAYGGPDAFRRFVNAAHGLGLGVILDVVYNHLGPEGNYAGAVTGGRFFTSRHTTPWGDAVNYDGEDSAAVRQFVIDNARHWPLEYHVDGLRLDATHQIVDDSSPHILEEIARELHALPRPRLVIAEDERNERRLVLPPEEKGFGLDAVWADDLHHQLRRLVAGDCEGYFCAYTGTVDDVVETLRAGWFREGRGADPERRSRGTPADGLPAHAFVHCIQNHDQVGNRAMGDRLNHVITLPVYRAVSALLLLSPYTPLIWMGQEWASTSPFQYFTDHPDTLGRLVVEGRRDEFKHFSAFTDPLTRERIPDPQAESTFQTSKLCWDEMHREPHRGMRELYRALLQLRPRTATREGFRCVKLGERALAFTRDAGPNDHFLVGVNFGDALRFSPGEVTHSAMSTAAWTLELSSEDPRFGGSGSARYADGAAEMATAGAVVLRRKA